MSAVRSAPCLRLASAALRPTTTTTPGSLRRTALLHTSASLSGKPRRSRFKNVHLDAMGLSSPDKVQEFTEKMFPKYTERELKALSERYTPEQMAAIEAGEAAIDPKDLTVQARVRTDPYRLPYLDDFSKIMPIVDKKVRTAPLPDPNARFMTESEQSADLMKWADELIPEEHRGLLAGGAQSPDEALKPQLDALAASGKSRSEIEFEKQKLVRAWRKDQGDRLRPLESALTKAMHDEFPKLINERSGMNDGNRPAHSPVAPGLGKDFPTGGLSDLRDPADEALDPEGVWRQTQKVTGQPLKDLMQIKNKSIVIRTVSNQTRLGKIRSFAIMNVAGTKDGRLGVGVAKSVDQSTASQKAKFLALQNLKPIKRYEDRTIYGNVSAKVGATVVEIKARPPGFGIRASHRLFEIFRLAGLHDVSARMPRGRNPMNSVKACIEALQKQKDPGQIALGRGKKMVDVRNVYFGGNVQ
ncbi:ribosomal protein S5, C-terminal domain-domain-containing protein [Microdochium bolleyi]|uniref:Ribosomal protein S5, C-terminal domain-domain-containing protein n=1 Tax=Microdochium bolleyi TaxID=196109 RepID=A0A136JHF6_9PEZI|nr:ribosomal protein S5, C-terminal domain-domain-containing protein [Microdochium bolleyi]